MLLAGILYRSRMIEGGLWSWHLSVLVCS